MKRRLIVNVTTKTKAVCAFSIYTILYAQLYPVLSHHVCLLSITFTLSLDISFCVIIYNDRQIKDQSDYSISLDPTSYLN